jgi:hypothetical protein
MRNTHQLFIQFIVKPFSEGSQQAISFTICINFFKLIDAWASEGTLLAQNVFEYVFDVTAYSFQSEGAGVFTDEPHKLIVGLLFQVKGVPVISRLDMYHTNVPTYHTMVVVARLTKVRC